MLQSDGVSPAIPVPSGIPDSLDSRERELADFVEHAVIGMHWVGPDGCILWANQAEMALLGYEPEEYIGHHIAEFHVDRQTIDDILARLLRNEELHNYPARLRCKDGSIRQVLISSNVRWEGDRFIHTRCFTRDVTELRLMEEAQARLAAIVESADDAIIGKTMEGIVTSWNAGAERLYGYTAAEVIGQPISMLMPPDRPDEFPSIMARLRRGERIKHYETERINKNGERLAVSVSISPVRDSRGVIIGASAIARDVSERKRIEAERVQLLTRERQARAEAEQALRLRDEFLSIASHELRTPLTLLKGNAQLLLRMQKQAQADPERLGLALQRIDTATSRLAELTDELLDVARMRVGRFELRPRAFDLVALVEEVVTPYREQVGAHHTLTVEMPQDGCTVYADPDRIQQVLSNLLTNAVKYSPEGGTIRVRVESDTRQATVQVQDRGIGLPAEAAEAIFQPFGRAANASDRQLPGLGLGLYICRALLEQQGGHIWAESAGEDQGTTFTFTLPCSQ
jgi:two-component system sensor histidine kinase VicK